MIIITIIKMIIIRMSHRSKITTIFDNNLTKKYSPVLIPANKRNIFA